MPTETHTHESTYVYEDIEYSDDRPVAWIKKGKRAVYGYSATLVTDEEGFVEAMKTHPANTSEMRRFTDDIRFANIAKGTRVLYDKGLASSYNRIALRHQQLRDTIMHKKPKVQPMGIGMLFAIVSFQSRRFITERTFST